jgi:hypothetical protein
MSVAVQVYTLWLGQIVSTDPLYMNPSIRIAAQKGGGVPKRPIVIFAPGETMIWEPTGEVRNLE